MAKETSTKEGDESPKKKKFKFFSRTNVGFRVQEKSLPSSARVVKTPKLDDTGLSYAAQHLMLLIQHDIDGHKIKVPSSNTSWQLLIDFNTDIKLLEKKSRTKEFLGIHHFSHNELEEIARRVTVFVGTHQPQNVNL